MPRVNVGLAWWRARVVPARNGQCCSAVYSLLQGDMLLPLPALPSAWTGPNISPVSRAEFLLSCACMNAMWLRTKHMCQSRTCLIAAWPGCRSLAVRFIYPTPRCASKAALHACSWACLLQGEGQYKLGLRTGGVGACTFPILQLWPLGFATRLSILRLLLCCLHSLAGAQPIAV